MNQYAALYGANQAIRDRTAPIPYTNMPMQQLQGRHQLQVQQPMTEQMHHEIANVFARTASEKSSEAARNEARVSDARRKALTDPEGNIYRGWAIQLQAGWPQFYTTVLVALLQFFGPLFFHAWGRREFLCHGVTPVWDKLDVPTDVTSVVSFFISGQCGLGCHYAFWQFVQERVLGGIIMLLLLSSTDNMLHRMHWQTGRLLKLFPRLKTRWMLVDVFIHCWVSLFTSLATLPLFLGSDSVREMILDAFGLLFLVSLAGYAGGIEFGIETSDFDAFVDEAEKREKDGLIDLPSVPAKVFCCGLSKFSGYCYVGTSAVVQFAYKIQIVMFAFMVKKEQPIVGCSEDDPRAENLVDGFQKHLHVWLLPALIYIYVPYCFRALFFMKKGKKGFFNFFSRVFTGQYADKHENDNSTRRRQSQSRLDDEESIAPSENGAYIAS